VSAVEGLDTTRAKTKLLRPKKKEKKLNKVMGP